MTANQSGWTCPNCQNSSPRVHPAAHTRVCPRCNALVDLKTKQVIHNKVGYFPSQHLFQRGLNYTLRISGVRESWHVLGILNMAEGNSLWDEILLVNRAGDEVWVSCSEGEIYAHREIEHPSFSGLLDSVDEIAGRPTLEYADVPFSKDSEGSAYVRGMSGAFSEVIRLKDRFGYWEGYDPQDEDCLSAEWREGDVSPTVYWSHGVWIDPRQFKGENRVSPKASAGSLVFNRLLIVIGIIAILACIGASEGEVASEASLSPKGPAADQRYVKYESQPMWLERDDIIDIEITPPKGLYPIRIDAQLAWRGMTEPTLKVSSTGTTASTATSTATSLKPSQSEVVIKLTQTDKSPLGASQSRPKLLNQGEIIDIHASVKRTGYYVIEFKSKTEKDLTASTSVTSVSSSDVLNMSTLDMSATSPQASGITKRLDLQMKPETAMTYIVIVNAHEATWLMWLIVVFLLLTVTSINRWLFGSLNKLFGLG